MEVAFAVIGHFYGMVNRFAFLIRYQEIFQASTLLIEPVLTSLLRLVGPNGDGSVHVSLLHEGLQSCPCRLLHRHVD